MPQHHNEYQIQTYSYIAHIIFSILFHVVCPLGLYISNAVLTDFDQVPNLILLFSGLDLLRVIFMGCKVIGLHRYYSQIKSEGEDDVRNEHVEAWFRNAIQYLVYISMFMQLFLSFIMWIQIRILLEANTMPFLMDFRDVVVKISHSEHWALSLAYLMAVLSMWASWLLSMAIALCQFLTKARSQQGNSKGW